MSNEAEVEIKWEVRPCEMCERETEDEVHPGPWLCASCYPAHERSVLRAQLAAADDLLALYDESQKALCYGQYERGVCDTGCSCWDARARLKVAIATFRKIRRG